MKKIYTLLALLMTFFYVSAQTSDVRNRLVITEKSGKQNIFIINDLEDVSFKTIKYVYADIVIHEITSDKLVISTEKSRNCISYKLMCMPTAEASQYSDLDLAEYINDNSTNSYTQNLDYEVLSGLDLSEDENYTLASVGIDTYGIPSEVVRVPFSLSDISDILNVYDITQNSFSFDINIEGNYLFFPIAKAELDIYDVTTNQYLEQFGIPGNGSNSYKWVDGSTYASIYSMSVKPDRDYILAAVETDADKNIIGEITYTLEFRTPPTATSEAGVQTDFSDITSTSVKISTTPDSSVKAYYVYVRDKAWYDSIISGFGESMLMTLIKYPSAGSWYLSGNNTDTWSGLIPSTEYCIGVLAVDNNDAEKLEIYNFTTLESSGLLPSVDVVLNPHSTKGHNTLTLNLKGENVANLYYAFTADADIKEELNKGFTVAEVAKNRGAQLSSEQIAMLTSGAGVNIEFDNLWRSTDYTCLVCAISAEQIETSASITTTTEPEPVPARVESELFESLVGEWEITYEFMDYNFQQQVIEGAVVRIAAGVDEESTQEYRSLNRLVILDYPFQADWELNPIPSFLPEDLFEYTYWKDNKSLAYRDYGPKFFLEIDANGNITVPTAQNYNFYGWGDNVMQFYGCDYDNLMTAPATFPVTLSEDGNTLTIKAHVAGPEFDNGVYRPAVFMKQSDGDKMWNAAITDIVLTRVVK